MDIQRGFRGKIERYADPNREITVEMSVNGSSVYDFCCFGVDTVGKLSDDRYMVFYNQTASPTREIIYSPAGSGSAVFKINLAKLPFNINKLVFTVSIDGNGNMGNIASHTVAIKQNNHIAAAMTLYGRDFHTEKAIISIEIYKKDVWRFAAVASGFNGGLGDLLRAYGGQEIQAPTTKTDQKPPKPIQIPQPPTHTQKQPYQQRTEKISLVKGQKVSLTKNNGAPIIIENGWTAKDKDYDLKALVRYRDGRLIYVGAANKDEALRTPEGAVSHGGDIKRPGELERITIKWHPDIASVAVSSYSALENGGGSFREYGVFVRIRNGNQTIEIPARSTSSRWNSYTLCFGEILYGREKDSLEVVALEMYSAPNSENRIGYKNGKVCMDIGPIGCPKDSSFDDYCDPSLYDDDPSSDTKQSSFWGKLFS